MLKLPIEDVIAKIKEKTGLGEEEIEAKINKKMDELSGLISKEGAAHIIANEFGIKLFEEFTGKLKIAKVVVGMRDVEIVGKVQRVFEKREFQTEERKGKVGSFIIADDTGSIRVACWGDKADVLDELKEDDIVKIKGAYVRENNNQKELHLNENSKLEVNPEGEEVGEVKKYTASRKNINDLKENDRNVEVLATVVQVFDPRFYEVCPECNRKVTQIDESYLCPVHDKVIPKFSYVTNIVLDDGTETIRCVNFKAQTEKLFNLKEEEIIKLRDSVQGFDIYKNDLLGQTIKVVGRVTKNAVFDRLEFVTQLVFRDVDPEDELKRLEMQNKI
ncbi:hypothetical protein DRJ17_01760 [Candidatus Woesearchaeota archaeon]|nr:MAG: hypothetical protein DRJ17_01760 [Candidatus Woesearchaeota archaeon]